MPASDLPAVPRPPSGALERAVDATGGRLAAALLGFGSRLRGARVFHPRGAVVESTLVLAPARRVGSALLDEPAERSCTVRLSRGVGLPAAAPDVLGVAIRVLGDQPQDLLFATVVADVGLGRHLLVPSRSFAHRPLATLLPYETAAGRVHLLLRPVSTAAAPLTRPEDAAEALVAGTLSFELLVRASGETAIVGHLTGGRHLPEGRGDALRFNPFRAADDLVPVGLLNALRRRAYARSQAARPDG